jgi:MFS family permease
MIGLIGGSIIAGRLVSRTGQYKPLMLGGVVLTFLGIYLLSRMHADTSRLDLAWRMFVLGLGLGPGQSVFNIAIQNALPMTQLGVATSSNQFFRQIGSTIGVAVFGTILTNHLNANLGETMPGMDIDKLHALTANLGNSGAPVLSDQVRGTITDAITHTFTLSLLIVAMALIATMLVPHLPLRPREQVAAAKPQPS